jgi:hypothetical protein
MNLEQAIKRIVELETWKKSMESNDSIPLNIDNAFRARFITSGNTASITYVSNVTQDAGTKVITVTSKTLTFTNGLLTSNS